MFIQANVHKIPLRKGIGKLVYADPPFTETKQFAQQWIAECIQLGQSDSIFIICTNDNTLYLYLDLMQSYSIYGYTFLQELIWYYEFGTYTKSKFVNSHVSLLVFERGNPDYFWLPNAVPSERLLHRDKRADQRGRNPGTVFNIPRVPGNSKDRFYISKGFSCQPIDLCTVLVKAYTRPTDLVIDLFSGSGSMSKAAHQLGRPWLGIDHNFQLLCGAHKRIYEDWKRVIVEGRL